jgi:hypothetical protein
MIRNVLLVGALAASFAMPAFAASSTTTTTATTAPKPAAKLYFVEDLGGVCKVSDAMTAAPNLTAPDKLVGNAAGYKSVAAAKSELDKLVKAKTCKTA